MMQVGIDLLEARAPNKQRLTQLSLKSPQFPYDPDLRWIIAFKLYNFFSRTIAAIEVGSNQLVI